MAVSFSGNMPSASSIFSAYASITAFFMLIQTILNQFLPHQFKNYIFEKINSFFTPKTNYATILIEQSEGIFSNELYYAAEIYLCTKIRPNIHHLKLSKFHRDPTFSIKFAKSENISDLYKGINVNWIYTSEPKKKSGSSDELVTESSSSEKKYFELCFDKKHKDLILDSYIPFVVEQSHLFKNEKKVVKLHTLACQPNFVNSVWDSINLVHPSSFDTLAMAPGQKQAIVEDLDRFVRRKDFYRKVGRAWKRGYLLYGPPGTGKSSLIAAIANYLKFDIYDLELSNVRGDSDLRKVLLRTSNRSILVIEDIDCSVGSVDRKKKKSATVIDDGSSAQCDKGGEQKFTLSGLLNFIDGLWSNCGDERIIIFTTNHKEKLDPALLRPGRMDMHIHMSYITMNGFKLLASTYLNIDQNDEHPRFFEIEQLLEDMEVSPAEVAEELMKSDDVDIVLEGLVCFLKSKKNAQINILKDEKSVDNEVVYL